MSGDGSAELSAEEAARTVEEVRAADELLKAGLARVAMTRAYFAIFHAIRALLAAHGLESRTHRGTVGLFNLHFVRKGILPPEVSRLVTRLQRYREEADYGTAFIADDAWVREEVAAVRQWIQRILDIRPAG